MPHDLCLRVPCRGELHDTRFRWENGGWVLCLDRQHHPDREQTRTLFSLSPPRGCLAVCAGWDAMHAGRSIAPTGLSDPTRFGVTLIWCDGDSVAAAETYTRLTLQNRDVEQMWRMHPRLEPLSVFGRLHIPDQPAARWDNFDLDRRSWCEQFDQITPWAAAWWHHHGFSAVAAAAAWESLLVNDRVPA